MKKIIDRHASVLLVYNGKRLCTNQYDATYPLEVYRHRINLIGGTPSVEDSSPLDTLLRELNEEFSLRARHEKKFDQTLIRTIGSGPPAPDIAKFASKEDIDALRGAIVRSIVPYRDFVVSIPPYPPRPAYNVLFHVYTSQIPSSLFEMVERNLEEGKSLVSEGFLKITSLTDVENGIVGTAWATGPALEHFFHTHVPNPDRIMLQELGSIRATYKEYDSDILVQKK